MTRGVGGVKEAVVSGKIPYQSKVLVSEQWDTNSGREVSGSMGQGLRAEEQVGLVRLNTFI